MNINGCGCRPYGWLGLDGNRCIRVIPRQASHSFVLDERTIGCTEETDVLHGNRQERVSPYLVMSPPFGQCRGVALTTRSLLCARLSLGF